MRALAVAVSAACALGLAALFVDLDTPAHAAAVRIMAPEALARDLVTVERVRHVEFLPRAGLWLVTDGATMAQVRAKCYLPAAQCYYVVAAKGPGAGAWR